MRTTCLACGATTLVSRAYPLGTTSGRKRPFINWEELPVSACTTCGFGWVTDVPANLDEYYRATYSTDLGRSKMPAPADYFADPDAMYRVERSRRHEKLVRDHTPTLQRVLDVGPGLGTTLALFADVERLAVEPDEFMWPYLNHVGAMIKRPEEIRPGSVDAVISSHQLEHLPPEELPGFLRWIRSVLRPGGTFVAEVPHASLLRLDVSHVRHDPHLSFFSPESLEKMLGAAGFETVDLACGGAKPAEVQPMPLYRPSADRPAYSDVRGGPTIVARPGTSQADVVRSTAIHGAQAAGAALGTQARRGARLGRRVGGRLKREVAARRT